MKNMYKIEWNTLYCVSYCSTGCDPSHRETEVKGMTIQKTVGSSSPHLSIFYLRTLKFFRRGRDRGTCSPWKVRGIHSPQSYKIKLCMRAHSMTDRGMCPSPGRRRKNTPQHTNTVFPPMSWTHTGRPLDSIPYTLQVYGMEVGLWLLYLPILFYDF